MKSSNCVHFIIDSLKSGVRLEEKTFNKQPHLAKVFWVLKNKTEDNIDAYIKMRIQKLAHETVIIFSAHKDHYYIKKGV
ncbi:MAG: hypothetical protein WCT23_04520 [Candidatus Neomarinimicrobiota bacterium]